MSDNIELINLKTQLRAEQILKREKVPKNLSADAFEVIANSIVSTINLSDKIVSGFLPIGSEVDIRPTLEKVLSQGGNICLPCVIADDTPLLFRRWRKEDEMLKEKFGTLAPLPSAKELIPDVIITPLLAFDDKGYRLGYGGGFYDRTFANLRTEKNIIAIGVGIDIQKVDRVPIGQYDMPLDYIVTEKNIYKI